MSYIQNIQPNTTYSEFLQRIRTGVVKENGNDLLETDIMKTGQILVFEENSYIISVTGDVNGDGSSDIFDILAINKHRLNKTKLISKFLVAGSL